MNIHCRIVFAWLLLCCFISIRATTTFFMNDARPDPQEELKRLCVPIAHTPESFNQFLKFTYNHAEYSASVLPNSFSHLVQFLKYGNKENQPRAFFKSVIRLFHNKIKAGDYMNAYAFSDMLTELTPLLKKQVVEEEVDLLAQLKNKINNLLYDAFLSHFSIFKKSPKTFLDTLSTNIVTTFERATKPDDDVSAEELQASITRFLELNISKLVWSPEDKEQSWHVVKKIADQLGHLLENDIVADTDDLDDLFWSLTHRYCFFLDITQTDLTPETFAYIRTDIESNESILFDIEEQEEFITSKKQHILHTLLAHEAKSLARERGMIIQ